MFNHTEWSGYNTGLTCPTPNSGAATISGGDPSCVGVSNMFEINGAHLARVVQLAGKIIF